MDIKQSQILHVEIIIIKINLTITLKAEINLNKNQLIVQLKLIINLQQLIHNIYVFYNRLKYLNSLFNKTKHLKS